MAGEPSELRCNGCGEETPPGSQCVASSCCHLFCTTCAQKLIENGESCPLCDSVISKSNVKLVQILQPIAKTRLMLCGQTPQAITDAALAAINFYVEQQRLTGMFINHKLTQKMEQMQGQCKRKLTDMHNAYQQAKQKCTQVMHQKNAIEQDNQELQQKYTQKAAQTRKLQEMFKALQQENEDLKRRLGMRNSVGAAGGGSGRSGLACGASGGGGSGRHPSPFGVGPTQMVTTVRQTKSVIELSPSPGPGMHLLTGHGSAVVGSGGQRPGTAGGFGAGNMFGGTSPSLGAVAAVAQRPGTSGGMFAAAALAGSRGGSGAGGGGGGGNMRLPRGIAGLGSPGNAMMSL